MSEAKNVFWQEMMEKISISNEETFSKVDFLKDTCDFFDISHSFIYEADYNGVFHKKESYQKVNTDSLPEVLDMKAILGLELLSELSSQRIIVISNNSESSKLETKLKEMFKASTFILIPVLNQHYHLVGFVGLSDRRKTVRKENVEIKTSCAVLSLLANQLKLEMFKKGIAFTEQALSNVLDHLHIDVYVNDFYTHDILYVNKSMAAPYGGVENMLGKKCWKSIFDDKTEHCDFCPQQKLLDENDKPTKAYSWDYQRPFDGSWFRVFSSAFPWTDGRLAHLVASVDITENKRNEQLIQKMARFDHLTGLPNRRSLFDDIEAFIKENTDNTHQCYVLFCDLDGFKIINDTAGHHAGDVLLTSIGEGLKALSNETLYTYRQGGDEFVVLLKEAYSKEEMQNVLNKLLPVFCKTYWFEAKEMRCGCSIGIAHYPGDATSPKELFHRADMAMYAAKKAGKGTVRFVQEDRYVSFEEYYQKKK